MIIFWKIFGRKFFDPAAAHPPPTTPAGPLSATLKWALVRVAESDLMAGALKAAAKGSGRGARTLRCTDRKFF